jgi:FkbM family methyltransferase
MLQSGRLLAQRLALKAFRHLNPGDIEIAHHFTHERIRLDAFAHRGYWFRGRNRERDTMALCSRLIAPGSVVLDVGGHIGYTALYFASLVGPLGRVLVAEPAPNNLCYLRYNIRAHRTISLFEIGLGDKTEHVPFFVETLTGQNCSFSKAYTSERNAARSYGGSEPVSAIRVQMTTLDDFVADVGVKPDFVKIDVEGFEYAVLAGASSLLQDKRPMLMIEIRDSNRDRCFQRLRELGYVLISPQLHLLDSADRIQMNTFCLHSEEHRDRLAILGRHRSPGSNSCAVEAAARIG